MWKRTKIAASAGAALAIAGAGAAVAAERLSARSESEAVIEDAAGQLGIEPDKLSAALRQALENRVDELVEQGALTKEQGDKLKEGIDAAGLPLLSVPLLRGDHGGILGFGPGFFFHHRAAELDAAASYLGLEEDELRERLRDGSSLAEIAEAEKKSVDGLVDALVEDEQQRLADAVQDGRLTDAQRDEIVANLERKVRAAVNAELPAFERGFRFGRGPFLFPHGPDLDEAASYLGVEEGELREALRDGKSLADVAKAEGKSVDGLVDALVAAEKQELQEAVEDGRLTDERRDRIAEGLEERVTDAVNAEAPRIGLRGPRPGFFPGGPLPVVPLPSERPADA